MSDPTRPRPAGVDAAHTSPSVVDDAHAIMINKVSWGAIFSGVALALIVQVLLTMLGVGIGVATLDPGTGDNPAASTFSIAAGIWYVVSGLIAAFAGGYVSARMSGKTVPTSGALHGLTTWAVTTLLVLYFLTSSVGALVGGVFSGVSSAIGGVGSTIAETASPALQDVNPLDAIEGQVAATGTDPEALQANAVNAMRALATSGPDGADQARQEAAEALAQARSIPLDQAQQQVAQIEQRYRDTVARAQQAATEAADAAAASVATGAILAFVALVLGAGAGWLGGRSGVVHPVYADRVVPTRRQP
ncbi:PhnA-like protein [Aureimonas altamirensis]|uniref:PhnA-like protein n=1 Tax=Aureimonas altamirensis TaxID=370622 RepID=UPI003D817B10